MSENGHAPEVIDLASILATTQPTRVLRMPRGAIREDSLTPFELAVVGRTLGLEPAELVDAVRESVKRGNWTTLELAYAWGWVILRRVEPAVTWAEVQRYGLDQSDPEPEPDPTPPRPQRASRQPGTAGRSTSTGAPGSRRAKPGVSP